MFARLTFPGGLSANKRNRDIARLIHDSSTGSANLSNLEFIDAAASTLVAGVNSGWSIATGSDIALAALPAAGTAVGEDDSYYVLEGTCADGVKKKYVGIYANNRFDNAYNWNDSNPYINNSMMPVVEYGVTGAESVTEVQDIGTGALSYRHYGFALGGHDGNSPSTTITIFATPRKLIFIGTQYVYNVYAPCMMANVEYEENGTSLYYGTNPTVCLHSRTRAYGSRTMGWYNNYPGLTRMFTGPYYNNASYDDASAYSQQSMAGAFSEMHFSHFPDDVNTGVVSRQIRVFGSTNTDKGGFHSVTQYTNGTRDGGTPFYSTGSLNDGQPGDDEDDFLESSFAFFEPQEMYQIYNGSSATYQPDYNLIDSDGTSIFPMIPCVGELKQIGTGSMKFHNTCGMFTTIGGLGSCGDEITIDGKDYFYYSEQNANGALLIEKE